MKYKDIIPRVATIKKSTILPLVHRKHRPRMGTGIQNPLEVSYQKVPLDHGLC